MVKVSYYHMENIGSIIFYHKNQILQTRNEKNGCKCREEESCPLDNKCLMLNIIYEAQITNNTNDEHTKYLGAAKTSFKEIYSNRRQDLKHKRYMMRNNFQNIFGV